MTRFTDDYQFVATSAAGAVGDVVAVDVYLDVQVFHLERLFGIAAVGCFNSSELELVGPPVYSDKYQSLTYNRLFYPLGEPPRPRRASNEPGFALLGDMIVKESRSTFQDGGVARLATLYFRVLGTPGEVHTLSFCDGEFVFPSTACVDNLLNYDALKGEQLSALSRNHVAAEITVLPGPATHPDRPPAPPAAKIYPEEPTPQSAEIVFALEARAAPPGAHNVPLEVYVTSNLEFSGYSASLVFTPGSLEVTQIVEHAHRGVTHIDNIRGELGLYMQDSTYRVGAEGERVHLATILVNVPGDATSDVDVRFQNAGTYINWLAIRYNHGALAGELPITQQIEPLRLVHGLLALQREPTSRGDANLDYRVDLSDAVAILAHLFQGGAQVLCPPAADANADGRVNISDPIAILGAMFLGAGDLPAGAIDCSIGSSAD